MPDPHEVIRSILAEPRRYANYRASEDTCREDQQARALRIGLPQNGFLIIGGHRLPVTRWNDDKPHRCPWCHAVAVDMERPSRWRVYRCCRCRARFTRFPHLARWLPFAGVRCSEHRAAWLDANGANDD